MLLLLKLLARVTLNTTHEIFEEQSLVLGLTAFIESYQIAVGKVLLSKDWREDRLLGLDSSGCFELLTSVRLSCLALVKYGILI